MPMVDLAICLVSMMAAGFLVWMLTGFEESDDFAAVDDPMPTDFSPEEMAVVAAKMRGYGC